MVGAWIEPEILDLRSQCGGYVGKQVHVPEQLSDFQALWALLRYLSIVT